MNPGNQDPWTWGCEENVVDDSQQSEWNSVWSSSTAVSDSSDFRKNKDVSSHMKHASNQGPDYFDSISLQNNAHNISQNWSQTFADSVPRNLARYPTESNTANYFNNSNISNNNSGQGDVENKEVAPPDHPFTRSAQHHLANKESESACITQVPKKVSTTVNRNENVSGGVSGLYSAPQALQDNSFQPPLHTKTTNAAHSSIDEISAVPHASHFTNSSAYFPPFINTIASKHRIPPVGLPEGSSHNFNDSNNAPFVSNSIQTFNPVQNSVVESNAILQSPPLQSNNIIDNRNINKAVKTGEVFATHKADISPIYVSNDSTTPSFHNNAFPASFKHENTSGKVSHGAPSYQEQRNSSQINENETESNKSEYSSRRSLSNISAESSLFSNKETTSNDDRASLNQVNQNLTERFPGFSPQSIYQPPHPDQISYSSAVIDPNSVSHQNSNTSVQQPATSNRQIQPPAPQQLATPESLSTQYNSGSLPSEASNQLPVPHISSSPHESQFTQIQFQQPPISQQSQLPSVSQNPSFPQQTPLYQRPPMSQPQHNIQQKPSMLQLSSFRQPPSTTQHLPTSHPSVATQQRPLRPTNDQYSFNQEPPTQPQSISQYPFSSQPPPVSQKSFSQELPSDQEPPTSQAQHVSHYSFSSQPPPLSEKSFSQELSSNQEPPSQPPPISQYPFSSQPPPGSQKSFSQELSSNQEPPSQPPPISQYPFSSQPPPGSQKSFSQELSSNQEPPTSETPPTCQPPHTSQTPPSQPPSTSQQQPVFQSLPGFHLPSAPQHPRVPQKSTFPQEAYLQQSYFTKSILQGSSITQQPSDFQLSRTSQQNSNLGVSQSMASLQATSSQPNVSTCQFPPVFHQSSISDQSSFSPMSSLPYQQETNLPDSEFVDQENLQSKDKDFMSLPADINSSCKSGSFPPVMRGSSNKFVDLENTAHATRSLPSPKHLPPSQTPPDIPTSQNSHLVENSCNSNPFAQTLTAENIPLDNDPHSLSRDQISFNFRNVHPAATSSPAPPVHSIPENQERLSDENHEMPDNTENLRNEMKILSLDQENESEAQTHCKVDRNQYLETGYLSGSKDHIIGENSSNVEAIDEGEAPPPGLHRLVTGQGRESNAPITGGDHSLYSVIGADSSLATDLIRPSSPSSSTVGSVSDNRNSQNGPVGKSDRSKIRSTGGRLVQGQSIGDEDGVREVPGEATPFQNRIVLGQMGGGATPPLLADTNNNRGDNSREREIVGRMVVGERFDRDLSQNVSNQDEFRQSHRTLRRSRRAESSYEDEDHDYPSDRDRRVDEYKRRGDDRDRVRHRSRREHRSPDYRSDEEFEDRRGFSRMGRNERRPRDFSPEMSYYNSYRDDHRRHRRYDHYRDYDEDYYYRENRSRPSSRTGSDYRRTNMDYMSGRAPRPMFYPDLASVPFNPRAPEEYYEAMRRLDPMGYAAWYNQYMSTRYNVQQSQTFNNDRASVHSGQSSTNNRTNVETPQVGVEDVSCRDEEDVPASSAHVKACIGSNSRLIVIDPHYPIDKQKASIKILKLPRLSFEEDVDEFLENPGPFVPGVTHRNTVLQYLKRISDKSTKSSEKLLYDLIYLYVKSKGELNGLDVADLLMESYKNSQKKDQLEMTEDSSEQIASKDALNKFRELLQQGNKSEALECAIKHGAWGHALFLASKMDEKTHNSIMLRFANSIPHTDPLQTLYQLMSGHVPQASTCSADKKWSDWRPHLAMILGNPTGNTKVDRKAIVKLGDSLFAKGRIFASHFCYIIAQVDFTSYRPNAKFVLIGSNPNQEFLKFATCRAIMVTMCYEYVLKLRQPEANIPTLQFYKFILAMRLVDNGMSNIGLQYCELIANEAVRSNCCERTLISNVIDLSSQLKMLDPTLALTGDVETDPEWLTKLQNFYNNLADDYDARLPISHAISSSTVSEVGQETGAAQENIEINHLSNQEAMNAYSNEVPASIGNSALEFHVHSVPGIQQPLQQLVTVQSSAPSEVFPEQQQSSLFQPSSLPPIMPNNYNPEPYPQRPLQNPVEPYWTSNNDAVDVNSYTRQEAMDSGGTSAVSGSKNNFFKASEEHLKLNEISKESNRSNTKPADNKSTKSEETQHSGWFGGIWEKLSIRPKNQMRLPDDSNPSIVWDEKKKKWVNLDGDSDSPAIIKPPPKTMETVKPQRPLQSDSLPTAPVPPSSSTNKYKLQKGKLMKSNYVNILGTSNPAPQSSLMFPAPVAPSNTNFFVPPSADGVEYAARDLMNPGSALNGGKAPELNSENKLSRCSSVSSLSREVQYYMAPPGNSHQNARAEYTQGITAPTMYNPARFPISNDC